MAELSQTTPREAREVLVRGANVTNRPQERDKTRVVGEDVAKMMVDEFFAAQFQGRRHMERVGLITALDQQYSA